MSSASSVPAAMIYGATGYTGRLIARHAVERGLRPIIAGRNAKLVSALATELGCPQAVFGLDDSPRIAERLRGVPAVLNCAGPFSKTARPMIEACLATGADYLDITGEIDVIEYAASQSARASQAGVALLPAVGFDVVPSDCLAAMLAERLPSATRLELAFSGTGGMSAGTAKTALEALPQGGRVRIDGQIRRVPIAWRTMEIPFRHATLWGMTIPWGDVASAYYSTNIPNIEVYTTAPRKQIASVQRFRFLLPLLGVWPISAIARRMIERRVSGPSDQDRQSMRSSLWGRVSDESGRAVSATLETLSGYHLTMLTAVAALQRTLARQVPRGYSPASQAFGRDFILGFPDTDIRWQSSTADFPDKPSS